MAFLEKPGPRHPLHPEAPDLPTGGRLICDAAALGEIYRTGRGSFKVRAKWRYLKSENLIEVYEIPYSTTSEAIMDKVSGAGQGRARSKRSPICGMRPT
ncbi:MAG: DNA gyrase subunit A [Oscillospiraceae bacterium]